MTWETKRERCKRCRYHGLNTKMEALCWRLPRIVDRGFNAYACQFFSQIPKVVRRAKKGTK